MWRGPMSDSQPSSWSLTPTQDTRTGLGVNMVFDEVGLVIKKNHCRCFRNSSSTVVNSIWEGLGIFLPQQHLAR